MGLDPPLRRCGARVVRTRWYVNNKHSGLNVIADARAFARLARHKGDGQVTDRKQGARKTRDAEATRLEILRVATEEFARAGLHGARVEEIAARTATSKHMIYYYFGSKDGLYSAALEQAYTDFRAREMAVDYAALPPAEALTALTELTFDTHQANPHIIRIIMSENLDHARHLREQVHEAGHASNRQQVIETLRAIIARGRAEGVFRADLDPLHLHMTISALCFHTVSNSHTFGALFGIDMAAPDLLAIRRAEVTRIVQLRALVDDAQLRALV